MNILEKGSKYIPILNNNSFDYFKTFVYNFENSFKDFNKKLFFAIKNKHIEKNNHFKSNDIFDIFMRETRKKTDSNLFPILKDSIQFKYNCYKNLQVNFKSFKKNITNQEAFYIKNYLRVKPFKIVECDKNVGMCIIKNEVYDNLVVSHLSSSITYQEIDNDPLWNCNTTIKNTINYLIKIKAISKRIGEKLFISDSKLGNIRLLFKLHKPKFSVRPIINSILHPTSNICFLLDLLFQPYVKNM